MGSLELIKLGFEKRWVWLMSWHFLWSFTKLNSTSASLVFVIHSYIWRLHRLVVVWWGGRTWGILLHHPLSWPPSAPNQKHLLEANGVASYNSKRNKCFHFLTIADFVLDCIVFGWLYSPAWSLCQSGQWEIQRTDPDKVPWGAMF